MRLPILPSRHTFIVSLVTVPAEQQVSDGGFTSRTRLVVRHLQHAAATAAAAAGTPLLHSGTPAGAGSKRRITAAALAPLMMDAAAGGSKDGTAAAGGSSAGGAAAGPVLSFDKLVQGHGRLDACRWFYEVLVLTNKGFVTTQQDESYGDIKVTPNLAAMSRV